MTQRGWSLWTTRNHIRTHSLEQSKDEKDHYKGNMWNPSRAELRAGLERLTENVPNERDLYRIYCLLVYIWKALPYIKKKIRIVTDRQSMGVQSKCVKVGKKTETAANCSTLTLSIYSVYVNDK